MDVTLGGIAGLVAALAFTYLVIRLSGLLERAGRILDETVVSLRTTTDNVQPTLVGLTDTVTLTNDQLARVDTISGSAASVAENAAALSSVVTTTVGSPLVKVAAFSYGVRTAAKALSSRSAS
ncbi:MAG TPA: DUF948 domain-containing protein [Dermatophilaceae bacterium]|nr:DUF948 domain-containing protein [Dermatophilaceae bacterium]